MCFFFNSIEKALINMFFCDQVKYVIHECLHNTNTNALQCHKKKKTQINIIANSIANRLLFSLLQVNNRTNLFKPIDLKIFIYL